MVKVSPTNATPVKVFKKESPISMVVPLTEKKKPGEASVEEKNFRVER